MIGTCYRLINSPVPGYGFTDASIEKLGRYVCMCPYIHNLPAFAGGFVGDLGLSSSYT